MYRAFLPKIVRRKITPRDSLPFEVFAYSGHDALPEQVASIRSFLRHAGRSTRFTIVSDGTYTNEDVELLQQIDPSVAVEGSPPIPAHLPVAFGSYLQSHPTGKQLALIMSLPRNGPALYIDSDIYFFPRAHDLATLARATAVPAFYLPDCQFSGDARLIRLPNERDQPVNTGALFLFEKLDWSLGLERFAQLNGAPNFFTNQTITHLVMHTNGASPLDPAKFVLQLNDQTIYRDLYAGDDLALRHYVNPVRHKLWTTLWRQ
jgi:hypothetical protein